MSLLATLGSYAKFKVARHETIYPVHIESKTIFKTKRVFLEGGHIYFDLHIVSVGKTWLGEIWARTVNSNLQDTKPPGTY